MNILVTGDTGFIGGFLIKRLEKNHNVTGVNTKNCNILNYGETKKIVKNQDIVFHLASMSNPIKAESNTENAYNQIYHTAENIIMACRSYNVKVVFTSTRFVYGEPIVYPTPEDADLFPICIYGTYKMLAEKLCNPDDYIIRLSNVYGPSPRCHSVVTKFIKMVKEYKTIPVFNNLNVIRDFVYIDDVIDALMLGLDHYGLYNVGSGVETNLQQLLEKISDTLNIKYNTIDMKRNIYPFNEDKVEIQRVWLNIKKIEEEIGWTPKTSLEEGIKKCLLKKDAVNVKN